MGDAPTVYLGQFTDETADAIAGRLEEAGIEWWFKQTGTLTRLVLIGEWGTRLFVDAGREEEARRIAAEVTG